MDILDSRRVPVKAADRASRGGKVPYYGATGQAGTIDHAIFDEPLVLLGEDGAPFFDPNKPKAFLVEGPSWVNNHAHVLRALPPLDRRFLKYYLDWFDYRGFANGTTRLKLTQAAMRRIPVPMPSEAEQRRIVEILEDHLSHLDAADAEIHRAQVRRSALLLGALRRHVDAARSAGVSFARIGELASTNLGKMLDAKKATGEMTPYLANINVRWGHFDLENLKSVPLTTEEQARLTMQSGDIIVCEGGEPGRCAVWDRDNSNIAYQKALHRVRVHDPQRLRPEYLALMLRETIQSGRADRLFTGTTIKHLPQEKLRLIEVPVPEPSTQVSALRELQEVAESGDRLAAALQTASSRSGALRRAVLTAAFEGKLTGRRSDDELVEEMADSHQEGA
ncbi:MAG TPA: restriction endonuclease subunit S [Phycicoccus elongatus]|uniref:restriction endonuclease subunit S n=1 Tax=Phycicoccus TaxID=367298 RepID=UPI001D829D8A|nr:MULTISPECIES: restriction endonuclease subunit S [Phycicoccus]MCB1238953.1 restriction endonuclease subunit S [Tetrasphaera sp.]MCB9406629.1 restriction endonuclease subunit S [Tetrasphaera sp.]MCO5303181.1 restriction endonuclease subunit S [Phycicoccus sp.]HPK13573.1 restriction endonuclease subunit S [Phycicoccus elongatus]HPQ74851.1 restriction endonuclease subunit S [Phycicoccus elongatus]